MRRVLRRTRAAHPWVWLLLLLTLATCSPRPSALNRVHTSGALTVATTNSPTTCYDGATGPTGYECDLLQGLAKSLGVRLEVRFVANSAAALDELKAGRADLAAAGLNVTPARQQAVRFTTPIQRVQLQLVYRAGAAKPADLGEIDGKLAVPAGSPMAERLAQLRERYPALHWDEIPDEGADDLLNKVAAEELDYTIANSDLVAINQRYAPQLRVAFDLSDNQDIAWALPPGGDPTLFHAVQAYLASLGEPELARLRDRYFGHVGDGDYLGVARFVTDVQKLLPRYREHFEDAAERYGLDWRLIAAIGYQESKWDADAVSYTGVRGIMMLTTETAAHMDVADREDPAQSIRGGARYFQQILKQLPATIEEPDRSWMALAAYNQGLGHLFDARALAARNGKDPDRWLDVRDTLPLLSRERWFSTTKHGYARGREAVDFVANVRSYYDLLNWMSGGGESPSARPVAVTASSLRSGDAPPPGRSEGVRQ